MEQEIRFCTTSDGVRIAYATIGEGPPLVVVSAWGSSLERAWGSPQFHDYAVGLSRDYRLIAFDRRGVGASQRDVEDFTLNAHVRDIAAVADHLQLEQFDLWGDGDGANVSIAYAALYPGRVTRLVLMAAFGPGGRPSVPGLTGLILGNWQLARRAMADVVFPSGPIEAQLWFADLLRDAMSPEVAVKYLEFSATVDVSLLLSQVGAPTLVVHRRRDRRVSIRAGRAIASIIPDARFVTLEGEEIPDDSEQFLALVREFLGVGKAQVERATTATPSGLVTILYTDMEGSTALTQRLGDAKAQKVLRAHNAVIRDALKSHGGSEVKHTGDGIMASFGSAAKALECAVTIQRGFSERNDGSETAVNVRIGVNAGEPVAEEGDLFGATVQLAARVCARAEPGQILAANVVRELAMGKGFLFADNGDFVAKGFEEPVRVFEVSWRG